MDQRETYRNTLHYALAIAGGELTLCVRLKVPIAVLRNWLAGIEAVPTGAFLDAVDIIGSATATDIARSRDALRKQ